MPTINTTTIGSGGTYSTFQLWHDATDNNLVTGDVIERGLIIGTLTLNDVEINVTGATTDATRYREILPQTVYDPATGTGSNILFTGTLNQCFTSLEDNFHIGGGLGLISSKTDGNGQPLVVTGDNSVVDGVYCEYNGTENFANGVITFWSANGILRNFMAVRVGDNGPNHGLNCLGTVDNMVISNGLVYNARNAGLQINGDLNTVRNLICRDSVGGFDYVFGSATNLDMDYCMDGDGTAPGANSIDGSAISTATVWTDAANQDFTLNTTGGGAEDSGEDLTGTFTLDYAQNTHNYDGSNMEMGPLDSGTQPIFVGTAAPFTPAIVRPNAARLRRF